MESLMKTSAHQYHNLPFNNKLAGPFQSMNSPICFISESKCTTVKSSSQTAVWIKVQKARKSWREVSDFYIQDSDL